MLRDLVPILFLPVMALSLATMSAQARAQPLLQSFVQPPLPYAEDALSPFINEETMRIHHTRHNRSYVDNLNARFPALPKLAGLDLETIMRQVSKYDAAVRNNTGGNYNHRLFWSVLPPPSRTGTLSTELQSQIARNISFHDGFVKAFKSAAKSVLDSGWDWLSLKPDNTLAVTTTANQDNPLMDLAQQQSNPLLALDVWGHAYYLQYQYRRPEYVAAWWTVANWNEVNQRYGAATKQSE